MMATNVILPALGMSQETGKIVQWLKAEGEHVAKGEPLAEIETDKATVEIEAPADGVLAQVVASAGDDVPVGQVIATILAPGELAVGVVADGPRRSDREQERSEDKGLRQSDEGKPGRNDRRPGKRVEEPWRAQGIAPTFISPLASRIAAEHNVDLSQVKAAGKRMQKADVLSYLQDQENASSKKIGPRLTMASPKARRLAVEQGKELAAIMGSGPGGAVLAADVLDAIVQAPRAPTEEVAEVVRSGTNELAVGNIWRIMAERTTQSWTSVPHFYLVREVNASRLITWRKHMRQRSGEKVTYTDLLVKIVAAALRMHPRLNASWSEGKITLKQEVHIGLAVAVEEGLVVPVIHLADTLRLDDIARQRIELVAKAQDGKLRPQDISGGTFTISNLGMYNVDAFNAIINQPQAAILAVGRIAERVVPVDGQPAVQPMMVLTLSCDHRAVDGARGAQFLDTVANLIEEPLGLVS
ncbi:MAG TPA: 2-oxo acid dehydrogenase subunit E2 [Ktedonobacteraceae bacterium]